MSLENIVHPGLRVVPENVVNTRKLFRAFSEFTNTWKLLAEAGEELEKILSKERFGFRQADPNYKASPSEQRPNVPFSKVVSSRFIVQSANSIASFSRDFYNNLSSLSNLSDEFPIYKENGVSGNIENVELKSFIQNMYKKMLQNCFNIEDDEQFYKMKDITSILRMVMVVHLSRLILDLNLKAFFDFLMGVKNIQLWGDFWVSKLPAFVNISEDTDVSTIFPSHLVPTRNIKGAGGYYNMLCRSITLIHQPLEEVLKYLSRDVIFGNTKFVGIIDSIYLINGFDTMLNESGKEINKYMQNTITDFRTGCNTRMNLQYVETKCSAPAVAPAPGGGGGNAPAPGSAVAATPPVDVSGRFNTADVFFRNGQFIVGTDIVLKIQLLYVYNEFWSNMFRTFANHDDPLIKVAVDQFSQISEKARILASRWDDPENNSSIGQLMKLDNDLYNQLDQTLDRIIDNLYKVERMVPFKMDYIPRKKASSSSSSSGTEAPAIELTEF